MSKRKQRWIGCLVCLLLLVILPGLFVWRERRRERLSAQLIAALKEIRSFTEASIESGDDEKGQLLQELKRQTVSAETRAVHLLQEGADPNARDVAVEKRTVWEELKFLLKRTFRSSLPASLTPAALTIAVQADDAVLVKALLEAGAKDVNAEIETGYSGRFSLVNYGAYCGNREIVQELCAHKADIHSDADSKGDPILRYALDAQDLTDMMSRNKTRSTEEKRDERERAEIFHLLLAQGARYEAHSQLGYDLLCSATLNDLLDVTQELLSAGVSPNAQSHWLAAPPEASPLANAVTRDDVALVRLLLQYGASVRDNRFDPLMLDVRSLAMARLLLQKGADIHAGRKWGKRIGENALQCASDRGNTEVMSFLIDHGLDVNSGGKFGPITGAAELGDVEAVQLLLKRGARIGLHSPGASALYLAIISEHLASAKLLLHHGAPVESVDADEVIPLEAAAQLNYKDLALDLLRHGANVNAGEGKPLLTACRCADKQMVKILLEHGADPNMAPDGMTAIEIEQQEDAPEDAEAIIALLKKYGAKP